MTRYKTNIESLIARRAPTVSHARPDWTPERLGNALHLASEQTDPAEQEASTTLRRRVQAIDTAIADATHAGAVIAAADGELREIDTLLRDLLQCIGGTAPGPGREPAELAAGQLRIDAILRSIDGFLKTAVCDGHDPEGTSPRGATSQRSIDDTGAAEVLAAMKFAGVAEVSTARLGHASLGCLSTLGSGRMNDLAGGNFAAAERIVRAAIDQIAALRDRLTRMQDATLPTTVDALRIAKEAVHAAQCASHDADFACETAALTRGRILAAASSPSGHRPGHRPDGTGTTGAVERNDHRHPSLPARAESWPRSTVRPGGGDR